MLFDFVFASSTVLFISFFAYWLLILTIISNTCNYCINLRKIPLQKIEIEPDPVVLETKASNCSGFF